MHYGSATMEGRANFTENNELMEEEERTVLSWALSLVLLTGCLMLLRGRNKTIQEEENGLKSVLDQ